MAKALVPRKEVPVNETWDLTLIYPNDETMFAELDKAQAIAKSIVADYKGKLTTAEAIAGCMDKFRQFSELATLCGSYAFLATSVDYTDGSLQQRAAKVQGIMSECRSELSFISGEIAAQPDDVIAGARELAPQAAGYLAEILREKPHLLDPAAEKILTALNIVVGLPEEVYDAAKLGDMTFPDFEADGSTHPLGYSLFEDNYEYEPNTAVRRAAFKAFSAQLEHYKITTATVYNAQVRKEKILATARGFDSVFDSLLFPQHVDRSLYNRQIDLITTKLAPHMRKYAKVLQKVHGLDKMTYADLKLPLDPEYTPSVTIAESRKMIKEGLSVMGEEYGAMIDKAYAERWVDFGQNIGKSTGGFCASPYGRGSYILLNWNEKMSDVFTLAHELGHAGHFMYANSNQSIFDTDVSTYFVEAPSTMNEVLFSHHLLRTSDDKRFRRWVLDNMVGKTYYHNFVTHLLEADYQRKVYEIIDKGGSVNADILSKLMRETLENFWGDAVEITEGAELTWMRQPHYYMGLYSYTYSAGLTVATQVAKRIENEGQPAVEDWRNVLKAGSTLDPAGLAKLGGVDITTDAPLLDTIATIGAYIDEIAKLTDELEG